MVSNGQYWCDKCLTLYVQFWAPDDGRKTRLKHVERLTEINKLWNIASCRLYSENAVEILWIGFYMTVYSILFLLFSIPMYSTHKQSTLKSLI